jgi:hypothetical protein
MSGRQTLITSAARKISMVGGSLRDVQMLAGHAALSATQRYIEADVEAQRKALDLSDKTPAPMGSCGNSRTTAVAIAPYLSRNVGNMTGYASTARRP